MPHTPGVTVLELPPANRLERNPLPVWEVRRDGVVIGRIEQQKLGGAKNLFYFAFGIHP
jgi:hypothetical protein